MIRVRAKVRAFFEPPIPPYQSRTARGAERGQGESLAFGERTKARPNQSPAFLSLRNTE